PSGSQPLHTSRNPRIFGWLWPTLFPCGVGMVDNNDIRIASDFGFHRVDTAPHVEHLLSIADRRFQLHKSFIFVMSNIIQRCRSSFKSRLAVNRSWFPVVQELVQKVDEKAMETYQAKLKDNPFAKPESDGEKAAARLMKYVNYVSDHIPGSVGDVNSMKQEAKSKVICDGLPHFFATVNLADSHKPVAQVLAPMNLAGRDIDLDRMFHALDTGKEGGTLARMLANNPVARAQFFDLMVSKFFEIVLGTKRESKIGVLGEVAGWYAVDE
ncbi:hypothetical protein K438DRAFT_1508281, partial [Mycena galopus ATCC 62051]